MTPSHSVKRGLRYRYYVSRACVEGRKSEKGTIHRVSAFEVESEITKALRAHKPDAVATGVPALSAQVSRVRIEPSCIVVELSAPDDGENSSPLRIAWSPKPTKVKRNIILPYADSPKDQRPIQVEQRDRLLRAVAKGRLWLKEIVAGTVAGSDAIAVREKRSKRSVQMIISLAFVAPDIIEAAIAGAISRGIGLTRLMDLPALWSEQREQLGLKASSTLL